MLTKEQVKEKVRILCQKYDSLVSHDKVRSYDEERTKNELIEPLFEALGWDMRNQHYDDEVIKEQRVLRKKADYAFRLGGVIRFFVEAKAAKEDLDNHEFAKQAISYGFNKGVTWAVLTDFEGLKVFNCEWDEKNIWRNQVFELKFSQYLSDFDKLWLLSKESFLQDSLASYAVTVGKRTPRKSVSELLLEQLLIWRQRLSAEIKKQKQSYTQEDIDEIVQRLIDRLIFIRASEDRGIEQGMLWEALSSYKTAGKSLSLNLQKIFAYYRTHYDSKLFGVKEDDTHDVDIIRVDDGALQGIIETLYYSKDSNIRYDFAIIDADILGNVYEQYLGTLLKTTAKRAKLEEGKTHRKAQGIYYTPTYIVDFIVKNTVGELLKNRKPSEIENIKILDPACGSGSFLIKAFDTLDEYFAKKEGKESQTTLDESGRVTRKIKILQNNLFGVDLDEKAVEIAQLNLLLKMAEKRHRLPTLEKNIQIGNSLIDDQSIAGDKAFKWEENFKEILDKGWFDIIIGNPPYADIRTFNSEVQNYFKFSERWRSVYTRQADEYYYFIMNSIKLLKAGGYFGFIVGRYWLEATDADKLREFILKTCKVVKIIDFRDIPIFQDASVHTSILILKKEMVRNSKIDVSILNKNKILEHTVIELLNNSSSYFTTDQNKLTSSRWVFLQSNLKNVYEKIVRKGEKMNKVFHVGTGVQTGRDSIFVVNEETIKKSGIERNCLGKWIKNGQVRRYYLQPITLFVIKGRLDFEVQKYKNCMHYLNKNKSDLITRYEYQKNKCEYYQWSTVREVKLFDLNKKIICPYKSNTSNFTLLEEPEVYFSKDVYQLILLEKIRESYEYFLGLLNSIVIQFFFANYGKKMGAITEFYAEALLDIPLKRINFSSGDEVRSYEDIIKKVNFMLSLGKRLNNLGDKRTDERARIEAEIRKTDQEMDEVVYKLYGITQEEKKIIEESLK